MLGKYAASHGVELISRSLITIECVPIPELPVFNWVFFSSRNAVKSYFSSHTFDPDKKYAAIGKGTRKELVKFASCNFFGRSNDTAEVGRDFAQLVRADIVLFPISDQSMKSIQKHLNPEQVINVVAYRTILDPAKIDRCGTYVFTSPSNVRAFLEANSAEDFANINKVHFISLGRSTQKALFAAGIDSNVPLGFGELDIIDALPL